MENVHKGFEKYNCDECTKISYKILDRKNILQLFNYDQCGKKFALFESVHRNCS